MTHRVEMRFDGSTLVVRISMHVQHQGGRQRIVAPDGIDIVPTSKPLNILLSFAQLAPDIVEAIRDGRQPKGLRLAEILGNGPLAREE